MFLTRESAHGDRGTSAPPPVVIELVAQLYATIDARDLPHLETLAASDLEVLHGGGRPIDLRRWQAKLAELHRGFSDGRHVIDEVIVDGDRVVTRGRFIGTHDGMFHGAPPTGRRVELPVVHIDHFEGRLLRTHFGLLDRAALPRG